MKKPIIAVLTLALLLPLGSTGASAKVYKEDSGSRSFSKAWSSTPVNTSERTFKYGYNTTAINEDYTHTYHRTKGHTAYVKNISNQQTLNKSKGSYAKAEIRHKSGKVFYEYSY
jgi:hypothetical protein